MKDRLAVPRSLSVSAGDIPDQLRTKHHKLNNEMNNHDKKGGGSGRNVKKRAVAPVNIGSCSNLAPFLLH